MLDLEATTQLDTTSVDVLAHLVHELRQHDVELYLARVLHPVNAVLVRSGFFELLGGERCWHSISQCVKAARRQTGLKGAGAPRAGDPEERDGGDADVGGERPAAGIDWVEEVEQLEDAQAEVEVRGADDGRSDAASVRDPCRSALRVGAIGPTRSQTARRAAPTLRPWPSRARRGSGRTGGRMPTKQYERELFRLQAELARVQEWVRVEGRRVVVIFEGRDAAGKGSTIKRVAQYLNPRVARIVALPAPTERERTQWYFQRYVPHLPAAGEIVLFDRSWYNRAGVERVMGFCSADEYHRFLHQCPIFERMLVEDGVLLRKYWFSVERRRAGGALPVTARRSDAAVEAVTDGSRIDHEMGGVLQGEGPDDGAHRHPGGPLVRRRQRRQAAGPDQHDRPPAQHDRLSAMVNPPLKLPKRPPSKGYERPSRDMQTYVPDHAATLTAREPDA